MGSLPVRSSGQSSGPPRRHDFRTLVDEPGTGNGNYHVYAARDGKRSKNNPGYLKYHLGPWGTTRLLCGKGARNPFSGAVKWPYVDTGGEVRVERADQFGEPGKSVFCGHCLRAAYQRLKKEIR